MRFRALDNILMIWIFLMLIGVGIGMVLIVQKSNAPADSQAGDISGVFIEVESADNRNVYSLDEIAEYKLTFRDTTQTAQAFNELNIKVQYPKDYLEPVLEEFYTLGESVFPVSDELVNCRGIDTATSCIEFSLAKVTGSKLEDTEVLGSIFFKAIANTAEASEITLGAESNFAFNEEIHSFVTTSTGEVKTPIIESTALFKIQNKCLGDYNGVKDGVNEVDIQDLVKFGSKYGTLLSDKDIFNYDLVPTAPTCENCTPRLDELDLEVIMSNYGGSCKYTRDNVPDVTELLDL
jgi:hypothetical protein